MTVHVEWVSARKNHLAFAEYTELEDSYGTTSQGKALLIGNDSVIAIEGTQQELLDYIELMRNTVIGEGASDAEADEVDGGFDIVAIEDVLDSVALAMRSETIDEQVIETVIGTVRDYIDNHYGG